MALFKNLFENELLPGRLLEEEGFVDLDLPITEIVTIPNGSTRYTTRGEVAGIEVGFAFVLHPEWDPQPLEDNSATFYWGSGEFQSTGPESDNFISLLLKHYSLSITNGPMTMIETIPTQVVGLDSDPAKAKSAGAKMKMFFHSDSQDEERYAEVFTNINIEEGLLEFHEKDNEYRVPLVLAFCNA